MRAKNVYHDQRGMVSFTITFIMIIVISLIVLGFAANTRRNAVEALDRQLSSQAFYAAETGINDFLNNKPSDYLTTNYNNDCTSLIAKLGTNGQVGPPGNNVSYTCLKEDPNVPQIITTVQLGSAQTYPLNLNGSSGTLSFKWQSSGAGVVTNCSSGNTLTNRQAWTSTSPCPFGALRVELFRPNGNWDLGSVTSNTIAAFLMPRTAGSGTPSISFGNVANSTYKVYATCNASSCTAALGNALGPISSGQYYMRLTSEYYSLPNVTITCGGGCTMSGAQIMIDATGRAQDVLRRILVTVPLGSSRVSLPVNALQTTSGICKRFIVNGGIAEPDMNATPALCAP